MNKEELVSIVVPIYNVEKYLCDCVKSIVAQTYKNIEIILVDDGSTDRCGFLCDQWEKEDSRIKVIHKTNGGLSDARNVGIERASGSFLMFIDSDDLINRRMVEKLLECFKGHPNLTISGCAYEEIINESKIVNQEKISNPQYMNGCYALELMLDNTKRLNVVAWNKMYKVEKIREIKFPKGINHEDLFVIPQLLYESEECAYIETPMYYHRYNENGIVHSRYSIKSQDELLGVSAMYQYVSSLHMKKMSGRVDRIYLWKLIDHYFKTTLYIQENNEELKKNIKKRYDDLYSIANFSKCNLSDKLQFWLFRWCNLFYFYLRKNKY